MSPLIQGLVKKGVLDKSKATTLEYEIKTSGRKEEEVILENKIVSEDFLFGLKSEILKIPLKVVSVEEVFLKALETIPEGSAKYYKIIPLTKEENHLEVGMVYPEDLKAREALEFLARQNKFSYKIYLITLSNFRELLKKYRTLKKEVTRALEELETEFKKEKEVKKEKPGKTELERIVEEAPISKVVAVIIRHAVDGNASDIHIEPGKEKLRVRFRLDGILHPSIFLPLRVLPAIVARVKILSNLKIDEVRIPQDGRFSTKVEERNVDFRVSTLPTSLGEKVVIRILDPTQRKVTFESLGLTGRNFEIVKESFKETYGMILATGPTGCGKSTTLYTILSVFNKEEVNIITLEDPVEYFIEGVNQSQVRPEIGFSFANGLRSTLRQDPDILMVGEIRDEETASLAIHAALTGHLLLSTLHTSNTLGVIPRLIDMGVEPFLLPPTLNLIIAQRLVRKLCSHCKKKKDIDKESIRIIGEVTKTVALESERKKMNVPKQLYRPIGCKRCNKVGYSGRIGVFEVLKITEELAKLILTRPSEDEIAKLAKDQGMITMKQDGIAKVLAGFTSIEEVLRVAEEK
jgi:type IV pilus assembly protein PilB